MMLFFCYFKDHFFTIIQFFCRSNRISETPRRFQFHIFRMSNPSYRFVNPEMKHHNSLLFPGHVLILIFFFIPKERLLNKKSFLRDDEDSMNRFNRCTIPLDKFVPLFIFLSVHSFSRRMFLAGEGTLPLSNCTPESPTTFLFAYSNDLNSHTVKSAAQNIVSKLQYYQSKYEFLGNIRFDVKNPGFPHYTSDIKEFTASVNSHLPDPNLKFSDDSVGSDVLNDFLSNTQSPICGATVFILLKRNPTTTRSVVSQLQKNNVFVRTVIFDQLLGGLDSLIMYNISSESNGLAVFTDLDYVDEAVDFCTNNILNEYLLYSFNPVVSRQGQIELPILHTPDYFEQTLSVFVDITVQNHPLTDNFLFLNLTFTDTHDNHQSIIIDSSLMQDFNGYFEADVFLKNNQDFDVSLAYKYQSTTQEALEIRMSINQCNPPQRLYCEMYTSKTCISWIFSTSCSGLSSLLLMRVGWTSMEPFCCLLIFLKRKLFDDDD
ncbi:hypothetical protein CAEBREN_14124 [Caenorhabditis brenneri]|uniref:DUF7154 domain-containing protein n=1 Tax=Caenorhabditis brenneri TaxID=135651 RepID=G0NVY8_CAEBE|nr:hypothetical protein CAEBREN_14124 [Caenorhabditis brenneri]